MLGRRDFLIGGLGVGALGSWALTSGDSGPLEPNGVSPWSHGAIGDGISDDTAAVRNCLSMAFQTGIPIDGGARIYAIAGNLSISRAIHPWIRSLRIRQLEPINGRTTLHFEHCEGIRVDELAIDVGRSKNVGDQNSTFGLWVEGGSRHRIRNVEVSGQGKNSLIAIWDTSDSIYEELLAHNAEFDDPAASDDVIQGIWLYGNEDCVLKRPVVANLTGNASYVGKRFGNLRTRGIVLNKNSRLSIVDAEISNVDQGIDLTGSDGNRQCVVSAGNSRDCASAGVKLANSAVDCKVIGHTSTRCGMYGFVASGPAEAALPFKTQNCEFIDCTSVDAGFNRISFPYPCGFAVLRGDYDLDYPRGIRFLRCRAFDRQRSKTMKYGFYSNVPPAATGGMPNRLLNCQSQGQSKSATLGAWE